MKTLEDFLADDNSNLDEVLASLTKIWEKLLFEFEESHVKLTEITNDEDEICNIESQVHGMKRAFYELKNIYHIRINSNQNIIDETRDIWTIEKPIEHSNLVLDYLDKIPK